MVEIFGRTFEHLTIIRTVGDPVRMVAVSTEEGYYIRKATLEENVWKSATVIYSTDDIDAVIVLHESELPEGAEILGDVPNNEEVM